MKYGELIHFDPIESVVQLREADRAAQARRLVETFVISKRMGEQLAELMIPQLQFDSPADQKGLFVVGNYGTGKSHLMAVISAIAERADLATALTLPELAEKATRIAGRFVVVRAEINSQMPLHQFVMESLQEALRERGVYFDVPPVEQVKNHKDVLAAMMAAFSAVHRGQGLLFVLDELLDYLRSGDEQELMRNLNFLRAVGEFCRGSRFRFIAGVQESLFDSPRFQFAADTLRRVKDRFEQMRIVREDVAHVVATRLLRKDARQQALVREHLTKFAPLYGAMNERMEEFVRLFPVHPAYLEIFERITFAEKREVLKTLSAAIQQILGVEVPEGEPGLIAHDSYWRNLRDNASFRSSPEIREVIEKANILEGRIQQAFTKPVYRPVALRIIHALAVHRLTTGDIYTPIGCSAEELRDDLCLFLKVPERDAEFLKTMVETVLGEILKTVSGQFLSVQRENGQYYLDLKKDIDFDSLIERRAETLSEDRLDRSYFEALRRVLLEDPTSPSYVQGHRIWEHELVWRERNAGRSGYLCFGAPNERSTAEPPRDFYLYFLQPFVPAHFKDERKADEVFFRLVGRDAEFERALRLYAGACELEGTASGSNKQVYTNKAQEQLRTLTRWLQQKLDSSCEVTYQGRAQRLGEVLQGLSMRAPSRGNVRDCVDFAASEALQPHFADLAPQYPHFSTTITRVNRARAAQEALRWIGGSIKSQAGAAVLDALELLEGDQLRPRESRYAKALLQQLASKGEGQVLNRSELVRDEAGVEYWTAFRLEPEFLAVVFAALVHSGDLVLSLVGQKIDAGSLEQLAKLGIDAVVGFKHVERPRDFPLGALQELFELLGLPKGLIVNPASREESLPKLQGRISELVQQLAHALARLSELRLWGKPVLSFAEEAEQRQKLSELKRFLEALQGYNSVGKLKNFPHDAATVTAQRPALALLRQVEELAKLVKQIEPLAAYLGTAEAVLGTTDAWCERFRAERSALEATLADPRQRSDPEFQRRLMQTLAELKASYQDAYLGAHARARLGANEDQKKAKLLRDPRLVELRQLSSVELLPTAALRELETHLGSLKTCFSLTKADLEAGPTCRQADCSFRPVEEPAQPRRAADRLLQLEEQLEQLWLASMKTLRQHLADPTVDGNLELLSQAALRKTLVRFRDGEGLPQPLPPQLVQALQEVLRGLERVVVSEERLHEALTKAGTPCTVAELKQRFEAFLEDLVRGKQRERVRLVLEKRTGQGNAP